MYDRMFSCIPGLYSADAGNPPPKNISKCGHATFSWGTKSPSTETVLRGFNGLWITSLVNCHRGIPAVIRFYVACFVHVVGWG